MQSPAFSGDMVYISINFPSIVPSLLTAKRDHAAARRKLEHAINLHGMPEKITIAQL